MTTPDSKRIEDEDPSIVETTAEELRPLYRQMLAIRRMEEAAAKAYSQGKIGGFLHLIIGQEAVCVGAMHLFDKATNFLGGYGIVGGHVPIAAGAAFASKYRGDGRCTLCFFGEGASTIGGFAEARYRFLPRWQISGRADRLTFSDITGAATVPTPSD